jgi:curved DNA binding protein
MDLGVHIDGFIAAAAHTVLVTDAASLSAGQSSTSHKTVRDNCISAAYTAAEVAVRLMRPGNNNAQVTSAIKKVADAFDVRPISGTLMHQMKQFVIDGNKTILLREDIEQKVDLCTFEAGEVYAIDIAMSSGDGRPRETGLRTTVYKRAVEKKYSLKSKASRSFFNDVNKRFPTLPFSLRSLTDEMAARMGVRECVQHELLLPYPVLCERKDDFVAHVKMTVLLLPSGNTAQITGLAPYTFAAGESTDKLSASLPVGLTLAQQLIARGGSLPEDVIELLQQQPVEGKKKAKKTKKAADKAAAAAGVASRESSA